MSARADTSHLFDGEAEVNAIEVRKKGRDSTTIAFMSVERCLRDSAEPFPAVALINTGNENIIASRLSSRGGKR